MLGGLASAPRSSQAAVVGNGDNRSLLSKVRQVLRCFPSVWSRIWELQLMAIQRVAASFTNDSCVSNHLGTFRWCHSPSRPATQQTRAKVRGVLWRVWHFHWSYLNMICWPQLDTSRWLLGAGQREKNWTGGPWVLKFSNSKSVPESVDIFAKKKVNLWLVSTEKMAMTLTQGSSSRFPSHWASSCVQASAFQVLLFRACKSTSAASESHTATFKLGDISALGLKCSSNTHEPRSRAQMTEAHSQERQLVSSR